MARPVIVVSPVVWCADGMIWSEYVVSERYIHTQCQMASRTLQQGCKGVPEKTVTDNVPRTLLHVRTWYAVCFSVILVFAASVFCWERRKGQHLNNVFDNTRQATSTIERNKTSYYLIEFDDDKHGRRHQNQASSFIIIFYYLIFFFRFLLEIRVCRRRFAQPVLVRGSFRRLSTSYSYYLVELLFRRGGIVNRTYCVHTRKPTYFPVFTITGGHS